MYTDGTVNDLIIDIIINEVEERPFLYNKTCEDYSKLNAQQKKEAFFNIALRIEECVGVQISGEEVIKLWGQLKNEFKERFDIMRQNDRSGSGSQPESDWPFYKKLLFLKSNLAHKSMMSTCTDARKLSEEVSDMWQLSDNRLKRNSEKTSVTEAILYKPSSSRAKVPEYDDFAKKSTIQARDDLSTIIKTVEKSLQENLIEEQREKMHGQEAEEDYTELIITSLEEVPRSNLLTCFQEVMMYIEGNKN